MKKISTLDELIVALINLKGSTKVKVYTESVPKFNKKGRESKLTLEQKFPDVKSFIKQSITTGTICFNYEKVKTEFYRKHNIIPVATSEPPKEPWYTSVSMNGTLKAHKTNQDKYLYMLADEVQENRSKYLTEQNEEVVKNDLLEFLPKENYSEEIKDLPVRLIKLDNIRKIECEEFIYEKVVN